MAALILAGTERKLLSSAPDPGLEIGPQLAQRYILGRLSVAYALVEMTSLLHGGSDEYEHG